MTAPWTKGAWSVGSLRRALEGVPDGTPLEVEGKLCLYETGWICDVVYDEADELLTLRTRKED